MTTVSEIGREEVEAVGATPGERRSPWALAATPAVILVALLGLTLYLSEITLDDSMKESLNAEVISRLVWEHLLLSVVSTIIVLAVAVPLGIVLSRKATRMVTPSVIAVANIGQGAPSIGLFALFAVLIDAETFFWVAILAMTIYSLLPALRNTLVGLEQVDPALIDAGRGIGMSAPAVLFKVELPLAVPVILAGIRTTLVLNVGTAALAAFIGAGGLGNLILAGVKLFQAPVLITGSVIIAIVALVIDWLAAIVERYLHPKGM